MLTILIVDDEQEEREGVAFLLEELKFSFHLLFAENGRAALDILENNRVDILYTDIRMPFLDGLELAAHASEHYPNMKIIIYSGYSDFSYAKKAIALGVSDYILKPVNISEFQSVIKKVSDEISNSKRASTAARINQEFAKKHILLSVLNTKLPLPDSEYFKLPYRRILLLEFEHDFFDTAGSEFEQEILRQLPITADYLNLNMCQSVLFFPSEQALKEETILTAARKLWDWIYSAYQKKCYIAVSPEIVSNEHLSDIFSVTEQLIERRFFLSDTYIFQEQNVQLEQFIAEQSDEEYIKNIHTALDTKDLENLEQNFQFLCQKYEKQTQFSQIYIKFIFSNLYKDIAIHLSETDEIEQNHIIDSIYRQSDLKNIIYIIKTKIEQLISAHYQTDSSMSREVLLVKQYIDRNYERDLALTDLAGQVYLSPRYLCTIFKKNMGGGINKYIKTTRMEKAKEFLKDTNMRIGDVAEAVGYHNVSYFCQSFKEFYGITPEKYRQKTDLPLSEM